MKPQLLTPLAATITIALTLAGCGHAPQLETAVAVPVQAESTADLVETVAPGDETPIRSIPADSIYPLLLAEFALRDRRYDVALENYLSQSKILDDPGVSSLTTKLAQFINDDHSALSAATQWAQLQPKSIEANYTLAKLLGRNKQPLAALPHMAAVLRLGGKVNFAALAVTAIKLDHSVQLETLNQLEQLQLEFPHNIELKLASAVLLEEHERYQEALKQTREIFKDEPNQLQAVVLEARILQAMGKNDSYSRLLKILKTEPDNHRLRLQYARLLTRIDMLAAAEQFAILVENSPNNPDLIYSYALIIRELGQFDKASGYFQKLLSLGKRTNEAHYYLGKNAEERGDTDTALKHYSQVSPGADFVATSRRAAALWLKSDRVAEFASHFEALRQSNPDAHEKLFLLEAEILLKYQFLDRASAILSRAIDAFPNNINLRYARSLVSEKLKDIVLMEKDLRAIIDQDPQNSTALNALGYGLTIHSQRYEEAFELIQRAAELSPGEPAILDSLGWVQFKLGQDQQALSNVQHAYQAYPDPEVAAHLAEVLWTMGYTQEASALLNKSLVDNPNNEILLDVLRRLIDKQR